MAEPDLAPRNDNIGKHHSPFENPFANSASVLSTSPILPPPCAQAPYSAPSSRTAAVSRGTNRGHDRAVHPAANTPYKSESMSSKGDSAVVTLGLPMDREKTGLAKEQHQPHSSRDSRQSKSRRHSQDPEKAMSNNSRSGSQHSSSHGISNTMAYIDEDEEVHEGQKLQEEKAMKILLFVSGPCVVLSAMNTAWACIALVITILSQPIRLCAKRPNFAQQLAGLLGPTLNLQLKCIYTPLPPHANEDGSYHTLMLIAVHMLSPFLSFVMMFAAWTLAVYWVSSTIVGDPAGQDKRDDGKETVLGLRRWWERWLMRSVKVE